MKKRDIKSFTLQQLKEIIGEMGLPIFRAGQIYQWLHVKLVSDFAQMSNLSKELRETLDQHFKITTLTPVEIKTSQMDGTQKYLFKLEDNSIIETVLMKYKYGNSVCISSQVGCRMGCRFCASTLDGLDRNLSASEMLEQVYRIQEITQVRVSHVVVMGSGEPLDNYDNLIQFIKLLTDENGLNIGQRNVTVSTCGLVPEMLRLAKENFQITLALSLHAPNDTVRKSLMPVANKYSLTEVLDACSHYFCMTGRRITFEYSLVSGVNDNLREAKNLVELLKKQSGHVNLIPVNPIAERNYEQSGKPAIENFRLTLEKNGIQVTVRREMGRDINGACGQLRKSYLDKQELDLHK